MSVYIPCLTISKNFPIWQLKKHPISIMHCQAFASLERPGDYLVQMTSAWLSWCAGLSQTDLTSSSQ